LALDPQLLNDLSKVRKIMMTKAAQDDRTKPEDAPVIVQSLFFYMKCRRTAKDYPLFDCDDQGYGVKYRS
jgi:hypothetical protein